MQDFEVFCLENLFLLSTLLRVLRHSIGSSISLALTIVDSEVVTQEFLSPIDLLGSQTFHVHELSEVVIVGKHKDFILRAL